MGVIGHWELHAYATTSGSITGTETYSFAPSNVFAWAALCETVSVADDGWQALAGVEQVTHQEGVDNFAFGEWALSIFRTGCTSVTFSINALALGSGWTHTRARWAMQFWS